MQKDFDSWNEIKKKIDAEDPRLYTVREIWWCRFGVNIGTEQDGRGHNYLRPALILRGFGPDACLVVPLTTSGRTHPLRVPIGMVDGREAREPVPVASCRYAPSCRKNLLSGKRDICRDEKSRQRVTLTAFLLSPPCGGEAEANCTFSIYSVS